jgi:hypothetical protein
MSIGNLEMITEKHAIEIAKNIAGVERWPWRDPVSVRKEKGHLVIRTNTGGIGCNIIIYLEIETGAIVKKLFRPR